MALAKRLRGFKTTEKVSPAQLALMLEKVANDESASPSRDDEEAGDPTADQRLGELVEKERQRRTTEKTKPPPKRPRKKPFPKELDRVDNPIPVPWPSSFVV